MKKGRELGSLRNEVRRGRTVGFDEVFGTEAYKAPAV